MLAAFGTSSLSRNLITGQNEREETTQDTIVTKNAACASYKSNYVTYTTATYTRAKRRWHGATIYVKAIYVKESSRTQ